MINFKGTATNSLQLNGQAPSYYLNYNNFFSENHTVPADNITRRVIETNVVPTGYISRVAIGIKRNGSSFGQAVISAGTNDTGTSFTDFLFGTNGRITSPAGTFALLTDTVAGASTANKLTTPRNILGGLFDGTADRVGAVGVYGSYTSSPPDMYNVAGLQIREVGNVSSSQTDFKYAPRLSFHWGGRFASTMALLANGEFYFNKQDGTTLGGLHAAVFYGNLSGNATTASTAANANALGGIPASSYQKNFSGNISNFNIAPALTQGEYQVAPPLVNGPPSPTSTYGKLIVIVSDGTTHNNTDNWIWQIFYQTGTGETWIRSKTNSGAWNGWVIQTVSNGTYPNMSVGNSTNATNLNNISGNLYLNTNDTLILKGTI